MTTRVSFDEAIQALNLVHFPTGARLFPAPGYPGLGDLIKDALTNVPSEGFSGFDPLPGVPAAGPGVLIGQNDNATSLRCKGPDFLGNIVQSYSGIFYDASFDDNGGMKTRFIVGANEEMDLELQSPNALKISAVGNGAFTTGNIIVGSSTNMVFNLRTISDFNSPLQLVLDRVDEVNQGGANVSDLNIKVPGGNLYLNAGVTVGAVVLPTLSAAQMAALTTVAGMIVFRSDDSTAVIWDGSTWQACW